MTGTCPLSEAQETFCQTWAAAALPFQGRVGRGVGTQDSPVGRKLVNLTKILTEGG